MAKKSRHLFSLFLIITVISSFCVLGAMAAGAASNAPGGMPEGMGPPSGGGPEGMPGGGPGGMPGGGPGGMPDGGPPGGGMGMGVAPNEAAIFIEDGAENTDKEYEAGKYKANIKSGTDGITIQGLDITSGDYEFNGIVATGEKEIKPKNQDRFEILVKDLQQRLREEPLVKLLGEYGSPLLFMLINQRIYFMAIEIKYREINTSVSTQ